MDIQPALKRIADLEAQLEDAYVTIDLQQEFMNELQDENKVLKEAVKRWKTRQRFEVA